MTDMSLAELRRFLSNMKPGSLESEKNSLLPLLEAAWPAIPGSEQQDMEAHKLRRLEQPTWDPPHLTFRIERHGGFMLGSKSAELHQWTIDVFAPRATCGVGGTRRLEPYEPPLKTQPLAKEVASAVAAQRESPYLKWLAPDHVKVNVSKVVPSGNLAKQTLQGRRKRLRHDLQTALNEMGWVGGAKDQYQRRES